VIDLRKEQENAHDSMPVNSESVSKEIDKSDAGRKTLQRKI
jgi:hypothetical protein